MALSKATGDLTFAGMPVMMDAGVYPLETQVLAGTIFGENGQLSGTVTPRTVSKVTVVGLNITITGSGFGTVQPSGYIFNDGVRYVINTWSDTQITGTQG